MRRNILLLIAVVSLLIALAMIRKQRTAAAVSVTLAPPPVSAAPAEIGGTDNFSSLTPQEAHPIPLPLTPPEDGRFVTADKKTIRNSPCEVFVFGMDGQPIEGASVTVISSDMNWVDRDTKEYTTSGRGRIAFNMRNDRQVLIYAYKPRGGGSTTWIGSFQNDRIVHLILNDSVTMKFFCLGKNGMPLENVEVSVFAEELFATRFDVNGNFLDATYIWIPARKTYTNGEGRGQIEGLPSKGMTSTRGKQLPGNKFTIKASLHGRSTELKLDEFPGAEVVLVLE